MTAAQCMINLNADRDLPGVERCGGPPVCRAWTEDDLRVMGEKMRDRAIGEGMAP